MLDPETEAFFKARLPSDPGGVGNDDAASDLLGDGAGSAKKRKVEEGGAVVISEVS